MKRERKKRDTYQRVGKLFTSNVFFDRNNGRIRLFDFDYSFLPKFLDTLIFRAENPYKVGKCIMWLPRFLWQEKKDNKNTFEEWQRERKKVLKRFMVSIFQ